MLLNAIEQGSSLYFRKSQEMLGQFSKALGGKVGDLISLEKWVGPQREESIPAQRTIITPQDLLEEDDGREAILQTLESAFYQKGFDAVVHQLQLLPPLVDNTVIDDIVESRTGVLEVNLLQAVNMCLAGPLKKFYHLMARFSAGR